MMKKMFAVIIFMIISVGFNASFVSASGSYYPKLVEIPILTDTTLITDDAQTYEIIFYLSDIQKWKAKSAALEFVIVGVCCGSRVVFNGRPYHLNNSEDLYAWWDSLGKTVIPIPAGALKVGLNTVVFEAAIFNPSASGGNLGDDFQFREVTLVLNN
jgi:hypothetical protein